MKFNPHTALKHQYDIQDAERKCVKEAVRLIMNDRPRAAARLLQGEILEGNAKQDLLKAKMDAERGETTS